MTERLDLLGSRNESWPGTIDIPYDGDPLPLTGAEIRLQWRLYPGAPGDPLIDVHSGVGGGLTFEDVAEVSVEHPTGRVLRLTPDISSETLLGLPSGLNKPEPGEADVFSWDAIITYSDGLIDRPVAGSVNLDPGVTIDA